MKTGFNLGILASVFVPLATQTGVKMEVATANNQTPDLSGDALVSVAVKIQSGDYQGALVELNSTIAANPKKAAAYFMRSNIYQTLGDRSQVLADLNRAIEDLSQIIRIEPENISAYSARADFRKNTDPLGAIADYSKIIQLSPNNLSAYSKRADVYRERKQWQLALQDYISMSKINPNEPEYYKQQIKMYVQMKDYRGIVAALDRSIKLEPAEPDRWRDRAEAKLELKDTAGAIADYRKAIELHRQQPQQGSTFWVERLTEKVRELTGQK